MLCCEVRRTGKDDIQWFHNVLRYGVDRKSAVILYRTFDYCFAICFYISLIFFFDTLTFQR